MKAGAELRLFSRRALDWTKQFAVVATAAKKIPAADFVIDGEVCALDEHGIPRFQLLQDRAGQAPRLAYFVFDLLWLEGEDLRRLPLEERRARLAKVLTKLPKDTCIGLSSAVPGEPRDILRIACSSGLEGIVAKEKGSPYVGGRVTSWLKIKCTHRQEFAIAGYVPLLGTRIGEVGGLLLALKGPDSAFHFAGKVGTGFTSAMRTSLGKFLESDHVDEPPVVDAPRVARARWSQLKHVAEVEFIEWTSASELRHPSFRGLRKDKTPDECVREDANPHDAGRGTRKSPPPDR